MNKDNFDFENEIPETSGKKFADLDLGLDFDLSFLDDLDDTVLDEDIAGQEIPEEQPAPVKKAAPVKKVVDAEAPVKKAKKPVQKAPAEAPKKKAAPAKKAAPRKRAVKKAEAAAE